MAARCRRVLLGAVAFLSCTRLGTGADISRLRTLRAVVGALSAAADAPGACDAWRVDEALVAPNSSLSELTGRKRRERLPAEADAALRRLACVVATNGISPHQPITVPPPLACPAHARRFGYRLALLLQALRRPLLSNRGLCSATVVQLDPPRLVGGNTPGAHLQQRLFVRRALGQLRALLGARAMLLISYPADVFYVGEVFWEALVGLSMHTTCAEELQAACARAPPPPHEEELVLTPAAVLDDAATRARLRALGAAGQAPRSVRLVHSRPPRRPKLIEIPLNGADVGFMRRQYRLMRQLLPLAPPAAPQRCAPGSARARGDARCAGSGGGAARRAADVVVHIRAGQGSRSFHESLFDPLLRWLRGALGARGVHMRVAVFHELASSELCCAQFAGLEAAQRARGPAERTRGGIGEVHVHANPNRISMMAAFLEADVLVSGDSVLSALAARLSTRAALAFDARTKRDFADEVVRDGSSVVLPYFPCSEARLQQHRVSPLLAGAAAGSAGGTGCTAVVGANTSRADELLDRRYGARARHEPSEA